MPAAPTEADWFPPDARLGPYRLVRPVSAGGMARVYEGRLDSLAGVSTRVALKVIHPDFAADPSFQELFIEEARVSARLEHQNLVRIQQFNREGDLYYLVMEFIDGITFRKLISMCKRYRIQLPVEVVAELGRQACEGLHYAHQLATEQGEPLHLVHRDVKPSNLMLTAHGVVKVLDFGISSVRGGLETSGAVRGTWGYMALEQAEGGGVGPAADVFGLGAVLYELATAEALVEDKENERIRERLVADDPARKAAGLGGPLGGLGPVLVRALQRDPAARFPNAAAFGRALAGLIPDPVAVGESTISLYREFRNLEGTTSALARERARSISTMTRGPQGGAGLPVQVGDEHGPSVPARPSQVRRAPRRSGPSAGLLAAGGLVALLLFGVAAWQIGAMFRGPTPASAPVAAADPAPTPAPAAPPSTSPVAPPDAALAPAPTPDPAAPTTTTTPAPSTPAPAPTPARVEAAPRSATVPSTSTTAATTSQAPAETREGRVTISSSPRAQLLVDGQFVDYTPWFQKPLRAGTHTVQLVADDGRRKTFRIEVKAGEEGRWIWLFDEGRFSEP